jgi:hypothetical protein
MLLMNECVMRFTYHHLIRCQLINRVIHKRKVNQPTDLEHLSDENAPPRKKSTRSSLFEHDDKHKQEPKPYNK